MTMFGDRAPAVAPAPAVSAVPAATVAKPTGSRPPWWCAHRSRSSAIGVMVTAALVCVAAGVAVVGFVSVGSSVAAVGALLVLAVGAANVVSGSFGAAWWARRASSFPEVTSMNPNDDAGRTRADDRDAGLPRRTPVVPAARTPRTPPHGGGRHAAPAFPGDEPTTQIPAAGPARTQAPPPVPTSTRPPPPGPAASSRPVPRGGPTDPTEALPTQSPEQVGGPGEDAPTTATSPRVAAKRAAARTGPKVRRVAGRRT